MSYAAAEQAFTSGDFRAARRLAQAVLAEPGVSSEDLIGSRAILAKLAPDPVIIGLTLFCLVLFGFVVAYTFR